MNAAKYFKASLLAATLTMLSSTASPTKAADLLVGSFSGKAVLRYNGEMQGVPDSFIAPGSGGLKGPTALVVGPDSNLYVNDIVGQSVLRYNGQTGVFIDSFVTPGSGGLIGPEGSIFGPDSNLYVSSVGNDSVLRYNGQTGAFIEALVPSSRYGHQGQKLLKI